MNRISKLITLLLLSLSVYFIYEQTNNKNQTITVLGDNFSLGLNSYGIYDYSYVDYYKDFFSYKKINIIKNYSQKDLTIKDVLKEAKWKPSIKKDLRDSDLLLLQVGYNDLIYSLSIEENLNQNSFQSIIEEILKHYEELLKELKKYYKGNVIVIGYPSSPKEEYYINTGIKRMNTFLSNTQNIIYIDTYNLLRNRQEYFSNPQSYYPNHLGYKKIAYEIITKTLEIERKI